MANKVTAFTASIVINCWFSKSRINNASFVLQCHVSNIFSDLKKTASKWSNLLSRIQSQLLGL